MIEMFKYNWQVREDWIKWCENIPYDELVKERIGGMGSILKTLFHVIDCEQIWINQIRDRPVEVKDIHLITALQEVVDYSNNTKLLTNSFLVGWNIEIEQKEIRKKRKNGEMISFTFKKILQHIIAHEIHHIGQLSIWARELGEKPVSSDLIFREFK
ncbi:DinB family protein [Rossellomorea aquimaris]|uniref:DinB family protein n=1 Tax=Rossellomorea aquimaris TaxID=189382 RepID=UPI0007D08625|nr:DinB family protein [Rossellomorea aquimaris]